MFIALHTAIAQDQTTPPDAAAPAVQEQEVPAITTVSVDGIEYSAMEYTRQFGDQPLHWVVDQTWPWPPGSSQLLVMGICPFEVRSKP
jgi:hypothetical protein